MKEVPGSSRFLPSPRVGALSVIVAATIVATVIFRSDAAPGDAAPNPRPAQEQTIVTEKDTDGDGVKDWEEELWGLSAVSPDSDEDGTGDADEIAQKQNLVNELPATIVAQAQNDENTTPIGLAGQILVSQFLTARESGVPFTEQNVENIADLALAFDTSGERTYTTYAADDLVITDDPDAAALRAYGNAVGDALTNKSGTPAKHELGVLLAFGQTADQTQFENEMKEVIGRYDVTIDGLLSISVPESAAAIHLAVLNATSRVRTDLADMSALFKNPIASLAALSAYSADSTAMATAFGQLRSLFISQGITFTESEAAYAFMNAPNEIAEQP